MILLCYYIHTFYSYMILYSLMFFPFHFSTRAFRRFIGSSILIRTGSGNLTRENPGARSLRLCLLFVSRPIEVVNLTMDVTISYGETPRRSPGTKSFVCRMTQRCLAVHFSVVFIQGKKELLWPVIDYITWI